MTCIYLIRHAESIANSLGILQGQTYDTPLSPLGIRQQKALRNRMVNTKFDKILVSPLLRANQTAIGLTGPVDLCPDILETNHGDWEGKSKNEIQQVSNNLAKFTKL